MLCFSQQTMLTSSPAREAIAASRSSAQVKWRLQLLDAVRRVEREGLGGVGAVQHRALPAVEGLVDAQAVAFAVLHLRAGDDELPVAGGLDEPVHAVAGRHDLLEGRCGELSGLQGLGLKEVHDGRSRAADGVAHVGNDVAVHEHHLGAAPRGNGHVLAGRERLVYGRDGGGQHVLLGVEQRSVHVKGNELVGHAFLPGASWLRDFRLKRICQKRRGARREVPGCGIRAQWRQ